MACIISVDDRGDPYVERVAYPKNRGKEAKKKSVNGKVLYHSGKFKKEELVNAYLSESLGATKHEPRSELILTQYLNSMFEKPLAEDVSTQNMQAAEEGYEPQTTGSTANQSVPARYGPHLDFELGVSYDFGPQKTRKTVNIYKTMKTSQNDKSRKTIDAESSFSQVSNSISSISSTDNLRCNSNVKRDEFYEEGVSDETSDGAFESPESEERETVEVYSKKYKPVALKVRPVLTTLPEKFRIVREIKGDPLQNMPVLSTNPKKYKWDGGRYTPERQVGIRAVHDTGDLWEQELDLIDDFFQKHQLDFAWEDIERGHFKEEYFPPVDMPVVEHTPWVLKNIPIPKAIYPEVCKIIQTKIKAGVYEPSNSSYRSRWFCVVKKDGKSLRIVHSLEPLNAVTIAHSGIPPATEDLAAHFSGRAAGGCLDLYVGYDERLIAESSRDLTTFQTPFGALRLVTLPMGWTNSVPIFHDDVTYILRDEIPEITIPYIDDVAIRGPETRYQDEDGNYETIPENPGIRRFVWETIQRTNRVVTRMGYAGGTFSGKKSTICAFEFTVVGHLCSYEGRKPDPGKVDTIINWGPCKDVSDVRGFLGTCGVLRMFVKDYAKKANPLNMLLRKDKTWEWGEAQEKSMDELKLSVQSCPALGNIDLESGGEVILSVDSSYIAIGFYIRQLSPSGAATETKFIRFGSITLNDREARFSQPKRELYGLYRTLLATKHLLYGVRNLVIETDAKYIKGMLRNPDKALNAAINRWIESILMFQFTLRHVPGKAFGPDGLSRRKPNVGDEEYHNPETDYIHETDPFKFEVSVGSEDDTLDYEEFRKEIDTRGGFIQEVKEQFQMTFEEELQLEMDKEMLLRRDLSSQSPQNAEIIDALPQLVLPKVDEPRDPYMVKARSHGAKDLDRKLKLVRGWQKNPAKRPPEIHPNDFLNFKRFARRFFFTGDVMYRRNVDGKHQKVIMEGKERAYLMHATHDAMGHKGAYATTEFLKNRFWWPELPGDVARYVRSCHICQTRRKDLIRTIPPVTSTPSIFQTLHIDTMHMSVASCGKRYLVHGRCAVSSWPEGRPLSKENAKQIGDWLFEDVICRWGCLKTIVSDNGPAFKKALEYIEQRWGIKGIQITPYNSRANGKIERPHWDLWQSLFKATDGDMKKWVPMFHPVMWAERITTRKRLGVSPFYVVTGSHPVVPLDILEATWLVEPPSRVLSTEELIGMRAKQLALHADEVSAIIDRVDREKRKRTLKYIEENKYKIPNWKFEPGNLVLVRNTAIEKSLNKKTKPRFLGPCIVIRRTEGGAYVLAEMDGSVIQSKISAFRVYPYHARQRVKLPDNLTKLTGLSEEELDVVMNGKDPEDTPPIELRTEGTIDDATEETQDIEVPNVYNDDEGSDNEDEDD